MMLKILFQDSQMVAIDKPAGLLVHRSRIAADVEEFAVQRLRDQIGCRVQAVHRLDRPTSGVLLFAIDSETQTALSRQFEARTVAKRYLALVRGWPEAEGLIDYPLCRERSGAAQPARTAWTRLACCEVPEPVGRYASGRYALIEARPETGRRHQIRRHFKHIFHPLIGDANHGDARHTRFLRQHLGLHRLWLHAVGLDIDHPGTGERLRVIAPPGEEWLQMAQRLGFPAAVLEPALGV